MFEPPSDPDSGRAAHAVDRARAGLGQLRDLLPALGTAELLGLVKDLHALDAQATAVRWRVLAEVEARGAAVAAGAPSTAAWLRGATGVDPRLARRETRAAVALAGPRLLTGQALEAGRISPAAASTILRELDRLPPAVGAARVQQAEQTLVELATRLPDDQLAHAARHLRDVADPDGVRALQAEEARLRRGRGLYLTPDPDGWLSLSGQLDPVDAATVRAVLDPLAAPRPTADDGRTRGRPRNAGRTRWSSWPASA
jgi:hypothetical protein